MTHTVPTSTLNGLLNSAGNICIVSHLHPDGDAVGSCIAMCSYLSSTGRNATVVLPTRWPKQLDFITCGMPVLCHEDDADAAAAVIRSCDLLICLDFNTMSRSGSMEAMLRDICVPKVLIDHHLDPERDSFTLCISDTQVSSACELLYRVLISMPDVDGAASRLPERCTTALMTGMTTDTNNFANSVFPGTLDMAASLLAAGVDRDMILGHLYNEYRRNRIEAMGFLLSQRLRFTDCGVAYMVMTREDLERFDLKDGETEAFVNIPLAVKDVNYSLFLKEDKGFFRVSIRSKRGYSANRMARQFFNGGGHEQAAGGRLHFPGDINDRSEAEQYIANVTARFVQESQPSKE